MSLIPDLPAARRTSADNSLEVLHRLECKACPLAKLRNSHPHMPPSGSKRPLIYVLGDAPSRSDDQEGGHFTGDVGERLQARLEKYAVWSGADKDFRFNNVVRTRPRDDVTPDRVAVECCRPSVTRDIEQTKPEAIFGFGGLPLIWAVGAAGIAVWRGRRVPVQIGKHTCWFYPMMHPSQIRGRREREDFGPLDIATEDERMFVFDLQRALKDVQRGLPVPRVHTAADARQEVICLTEGGKDGLRQVEEVLHWAAAQPVIGIDYETDRLRPFAPDARILTVAVGTPDRAYAFPIEHPEAPWSEREKAVLFDRWRTFLRSAKGVKAVHNLAFEMEWTGVKVGEEHLRAGKWGCSAIQASILDERRGKQKPGPYSLDFLVLQHFGFNLKQLTSLDRKRLADAPMEAVLLYNGMDAKYHAALWTAQDVRIRQEGLEEAYRLALRRVPAVVLAQIRGVPVNQTTVKKLVSKYERRVTKAEQEIAAQPLVKKYEKLNNRKFNPYANGDVVQLLYKQEGYAECAVKEKYTNATKLSSDKKVLEQIADKYDEPFCDWMLELRESSKRLSTYCYPLLYGHENSVVYPDKLLHAVFNTYFAETGRLSCEDPNLQNFPKRDGEAREVRKPIEAPPGHIILAFDYGQIEARVIAMFTQDKRFCDALWTNYDVHMDWAERVAAQYPRRVWGAGKPPSDKEERKKLLKMFRTDIKNQWTFPLFFGAQLESVAGYLKLTAEGLRPLERLYRDFWEEFSGVKTWQEEQLKFYKKYGYVECLTDRRRRGPLTTNQIYNSPIQGTACEIVMDGMCRLSETAEPLLQPEINIHDDLTFLRVPLEEEEAVVDKVSRMLVDVPFDFVNVPITVELSRGTNWLELEEVATFSSDKLLGKKRSVS